MRINSGKIFRRKKGRPDRAAGGIFLPYGRVGKTVWMGVWRGVRGGKRNARPVPRVSQKNAIDCDGFYDCFHARKTIIKSWIKNHISAGFSGRASAPGGADGRCSYHFRAEGSCGVSMRRSSGRTVRSMVIKQARPPTTFEIGSARKTPSVPKPKRVGRA